MSSISNFTTTEHERKIFDSDYEPWYHSHSKYDGRVYTGIYFSRGRSSPFGNFSYDMKQWALYAAHKKFTEQWLKLAVIQQYQIIPGHFTRL